MGSTVPFPLSILSVTYIAYLSDVQLGISVIFYRQLLPMLKKGKQTCHTKVSINHSLNKA